MLRPSASRVQRAGFAGSTIRLTPDHGDVLGRVAAPPVYGTPERGDWCGGRVHLTFTPC
ncbi:MULTISPECIES: hypothetical protein [unclassified Nonomuraea]